MNMCVLSNICYKYSIHILLHILSHICIFIFYYLIFKSMVFKYMKSDYRQVKIKKHIAY